MQNINRFIQFQWFLQKKNRNEKSESKRLNWTCIPKKCSWLRLGCIKNWWGFHSPPFVRQFGQMENADKWFSLNTCPLLINTFRKYIANESFEFQHLKCNRAQKKATNCELLIQIENAYWNDVLLCRSTEQHIHLLAHYTHTHQNNTMHAVIRSTYRFVNRNEIERTKFVTTFIYLCCIVHTFRLRSENAKTKHVLCDWSR